MEEEISIEKRKLIKAMTVFAIILSVFVAAKTVVLLREYKFIGQGVNPTNTISVSGEGDVFAVPDIAQFSFSVNVTRDSVPEAQEEAAKILNRAIEYLENNDVDKEDIKTTNYSVYPRYEYLEIRCITYPCPQGERMLVGYEINQSISVKARDVDSVGKLLSGVGDLGVTNVSSISFTIDDEDELKRDARALAIDDAGKKAKDLSKDLGVKLGRVVSFSESGAYPIYARMESVIAIDSAGSKEIVPDIPVGENKITSNVTIVYEIR